MRKILLVVLLAGCGGTQAPCEPNEVACESGPERCFMTCNARGEWERSTCAPACGPTIRVVGANETSCAFSAVECTGS